MMKIAQRPERAADEGFLRRLYASTRAAEMARVPWPEAAKAQFLNRQFDLQRHHYRTQYPNAQFLVVTMNRRPAGRWYLDRGADGFSLIDVCLLPEYRGQGIGRHLLEALLTEAGAHGKPVRLHVESGNPARRLYLRLGFVFKVELGFYWLMEWSPPR